MAFRSKISRRYDKFRRGRGPTDTRIRSKHMRRWFIVQDSQQRPMLTPPDSKGDQHPVESRATARRPWTVRAENRARNRRAKLGRRAAR